MQDAASSHPEPLHRWRKPPHLPPKGMWEEIRKTDIVKWHRTSEPGDPTPSSS